MSLFLIVFFAVFFGTHSYVWYRLVRAPALPLVLATVVTAWLLFGAIGGPLILFGQRSHAPAQVRPWLNVFLGWLGTFFLLFVVCAATDIALRSLYAASRAAPPAVVGNAADWLVSRRLWLLRAAAALSVLLAFGLSAWSRRRAKAGAQLVEVPVNIGRWPRALDGFRVAHLSDLHVAPLLGRDYVRRVVERTMAAQPDCIVLTGDFVDGTVEHLATDIAPLADLQAPHGVYFVTGNHEYYSGVDAWLAHFRDLGIKPLRNEHVRLSRGQASFVLAGIDDWTAHHFGNGHGADLDRALEHCGEEQAIVLLAHQPKAIYQAAAAKVDLVLSGHTHGGQIWPFGYLVRLAQPYLSGLYRHNYHTQIYVNPGTGYWGPPMRLGTTAQVALLTLHSPAES